MDLFKRIERIIFDEGLSLSEFYDKSGFSSKVYYAIKNGDKTSLKPSQAKKLNEAFPNYTYDWLMGNTSIVNEPNVSYGSIMDLAKEGKLGVVLNKNHNALLEMDESYGLWFDKMVNVAALKLLKEKL
jgi:hypothetical protein|tara:strand:+ start:20436 stop:20819 length:384 start_codon:yes stop_codon:yes gene_type:complete